MNKMRSLLLMCAMAQVGTVACAAPPCEGDLPPMSFRVEFGTHLRHSDLLIYDVVVASRKQFDISVKVKGGLGLPIVMHKAGPEMYEARIFVVADYIHSEQFVTKSDLVTDPFIKMKFIAYEKMENGPKSPPGKSGRGAVDVITNFPKEPFLSKIIQVVGESGMHTFDGEEPDEEIPLLSIRGGNGKTRHVVLTVREHNELLDN